MAGYWLSYFFCTSMGQDKGMLHKNTQKKKKNKAINQYLDQTQHCQSYNERRYWSLISPLTCHIHWLWHSFPPTTPHMSGPGPLACSQEQHILPSEQCTSLNTSMKRKMLISLHNLTSVCIFSILFSIHFLRCWQGESITDQQYVYHMFNAY